MKSFALTILTVLAYFLTTMPANAARYPDPAHVVYSTAELRANIARGPHCIHLDNWENHAYYGKDGNPTGGGFDYTDDGAEHIVWVKGTPKWMAARAETAFAVIAASHPGPDGLPGVGHIHGWTCARYSAAQVPA